MTSGISNVSFWDALCLTVLFAIVGTLIAQCSRKIAQLDRRERKTRAKLELAEQANTALLREVGRLRIAVRDDQLAARLNVTQTRRQRPGGELSATYCAACQGRAEAGDTMVWANDVLVHERCI